MKQRRQKTVHKAPPSSLDRFAWSNRPYGRVFNNLTLPNTPQGCLELAGIFGEDLMARAAEAGATTAIFDSRHQWYALHDSPVCWKHPALKSRDLVTEMIEAGDKRGIQYVPYIPVDCDLRAWTEHPDWRNKDAEGKDLTDTMPRVCENSPFREFMGDYLSDLTRRYDIGGFWFDGLGVRTDCYCSYCCKGFKKATGRDAPRSASQDPEEWKLWVAYKHQATQQALEVYLDAGRSVKPGLPVHVAWESGAHGASQVWIEAYWKWPTPFLQLMRNESGKAAEFYIPATQYAPSYPISLTTAELRDRAMISVSNGTMPNFTLMTCMESLRVVNKELQARAPWLTDTQPVPYVAVGHSERSKNLCEKDRYKDGPDYTLYGNVMALLEEKIPQTCLSDHNLDNDDLTPYAVVVLPDIGIISDALADKLRAFVKKGGGLVAGYRTSLCNDDGGERSDFGLADLFGVHYRGAMPDVTELPAWVATLTGKELPNSMKFKFLQFGKHPIIDDPIIRDTRAEEAVPAFRRGRPEGYDLPYPGAMFRVEADRGVKTVLSEMYQQPGRQWPMMTTRTFGKGRVVYIAANLGFQYAGHWTWPFVRRLMTNAVRWAAGDQLPPVQVDSLLQVHPTVYQQSDPNRLVVHLLNSPVPQGYPPMTRQTWESYMTSFGRMREDLAPVFDIKVRLRGRYGKIYTAPDHKTLTQRYRDGYTHVTVPRLDTHIMVVAESK